MQCLVGDSICVLLQTLATCVSSFASIGYYSPELYERAAEQVVQSVMQADLQVDVHAGTLVLRPCLSVYCMSICYFMEASWSCHSCTHS